VLNVTKYIIFFYFLLTITGCTSFLASASGTFVGNIVSDKVIKEMDKNKK
jgi:hypothetical protein